MAGEHAEIALGAGQIDLVGPSPEDKSFLAARHEIEVQGGMTTLPLSPRHPGLDPGSIFREMDCRIKSAMTP